MEEDRVTVLSETYMISLSDTSENVTLVEDMQIDSVVGSALNGCGEEEALDNDGISKIQSIPAELDFCKSSIEIGLSDKDLKRQNNLQSDLIKFFGLRMPLTKSYATYAQKRRNKRLYLPVPSKLKCNKCYFRTQSHFALKIHIEQNHSDKTWYLCMSCDRTSDTEALMREHVESSILYESLQLLKNDVNDNLSISEELIKLNDKKRDKNKNNYSKKRLLHNGGYICIKGKTNSDKNMVL